VKRYNVKRVDVKDTSGAGDSFMAGLVIKYMETEDIVQSIQFANICAAEVVKHRGVTVIS
jgi:sugar/nucleoside kinase (ribokinase family)